MYPSKENKSDGKKTKGRFTSGANLSEKEFHDGIKKAEEGAFYTVEESINHFEAWGKRANIYKKPSVLVSKL
ncbi:MAG: hypothetical protein WD037_11410 [Balneolales bacterium]